MISSIYIEELLLDYTKRVYATSGESREKIDADFLANIKKLRDKFPTSYFTFYDRVLSLEEAYKQIENIKNYAAANYAPIECHYTGIVISDIIGDKVIETPDYSSCRDTIFGILSYLLSLPIKKIQVVFIDLKASSWYDFFLKNISPKLYRVITTEEELEKHKKELKDRIIKFKQQYGDYREYCRKNKTIPIPYVVSVCNHNYDSTDIPFDMEAGIAKEEIGQSCSADFEKRKEFVKSSHFPTLLKCTPIEENKNLLKAFIEYINSEAEKEEEAVVLTQDLKQLATAPYEKNPNNILLPIGRSVEGDVNFCMDMVSHVHSFVLGQSGSGKSVFLHNIIGNAILKYAPEDLQLYLLDFKLGGVEFNRYRNIKHVKSLLVDSSDQQITLEILRELREFMAERGRQLRDAGAKNLTEYNKQHPTSPMPQILVVVDECHEMFRVGGDVPRLVSNEISEIVTKIAKEGRSQGIHLVLATQTLSGTEISSEILNNISDHYLLKCATADSERMVERSTEITSGLSTGQIYYHHVDSQVKFQAYYTDKEAAAQLIELAQKKAQEHPSNGEYYFNGSQLFKLGENVLSQDKKWVKYPVAYMGKNISISQNDLSITLRKDYSENILLFGLNDMEQVTRTTMNVFISLLLTTKCKGMNIAFKVLNCLPEEGSKYTKLLEILEEDGYCDIIEGRKERGKFLKQLAEEVNQERASETILLILGQERFREMKMDMELGNEESKSCKDDNTFGLGDFSFGGNDTTQREDVKTFKQALEVILDKGPELGVHTVMQLDKPSNFLFSDYVSPKMVFQKFKHLIMLKSDEAASAQLHLNDNIRLETLSKELERLRAYYYSDESDSYTLFTPYMDLSEEEAMNLLKSE